VAVRFLFHYAIPISTFAFCYGRIFHTIRRQSKVVAGHVSRSQDVAVASTSRDPNAGQVQQQATGTTTGANLSRTELNILKTMITVILCFMVCWSVADFANLLQLFGVSTQCTATQLTVMSRIWIFSCGQRTCTLFDGQLDVIVLQCIRLVVGLEYIVCTILLLFSVYI